ncbi:undecaprenyldiphospho-muramoylpentapeptide beta-N-acetylglucosaminyltransferase [Ramlibacter rhizophilus]|uniref:UDP-N-acetylglucosamine--N-acetylmuramyl-(pentapeptide) pyrophosphoryl-undecaprenol N-acetylglucosamine transferase n=1 Tax=Ramlibacter rhizophilus TaxID=1781167 RepID=A0A4Z0BLU6_9BURK|nr:undecaprenyldiphospho-muramoylpentapeptide beta-N-acetylglucosaminyltransferase [Ramlibacter rhizophilus]TFY99731.1 undecaprenyldiphospho-muramoylpentapeptide beta-N-acetylglucosaminyltransferase [Ramlibacter rhizophilus]
MSTALIMAGGTGGHIFPGLAVAEALREKGWLVVWMGAPESMESRLVPERGFDFEPVSFGGVRGKDIKTYVLLPLKLQRAFWQAARVIRRIKPDVVLGLGGYISFPGGMMGVLQGKPLVLHEQNSRAGMANKVLAGVADRVFTAFPGVLSKAECIGNPLRESFLRQPPPAERLGARSGPLRLLVVGGSLGARALNELVPQALKRLPASHRPQVLHQSGVRMIEELRTHYQSAGVEAELTPFIEDTARAYAEADLIVCRAGASTVTEIAAVGAAAVYVPFPHAVDDHQTSNARFIVDAGGGWLMQQRELTPEWLASLLARVNRAELIQKAQAAKAVEKTGATAAIVAACEQLVQESKR